jgi:PP-loop superfamily ATP-utilizing enzyme
MFSRNALVAFSGHADVSLLLAIAVRRKASDVATV